VVQAAEVLTLGGQAQEPQIKVLVVVQVTAFRMLAPVEAVLRQLVEEQQTTWAATAAAVFPRQ
jgi:hypothetical protein